MPAKDIARLLEVSAPHNSLLYETAFISGLRALELRHLDRAKHLDRDRGGLHLESAWTKNRKPGFQPLPARLVAELDAFARSGAPTRLYVKAYKGRPSETPDEPLLYVPSHPARTLDRDLEAAGIAKHTPKGKVDFHAARTA